MEDNRRFNIKYTLTTECKLKGFGIKDKATEEGLADALLMVALSRETGKAHEGWVNFSMWSLDGALEEDQGIPNAELFSIWGMLAARLKSLADLKDWQREMAANVYGQLQEIMTVRLKEKKEQLRESIIEYKAP